MCEALTDRFNKQLAPAYLLSARRVGSVACTLEHQCPSVDRPNYTERQKSLSGRQSLDCVSSSPVMGGGVQRIY